MTFTRKVSFAAAYDKRDPNPNKNYGIHGVHITFTLKDIDKKEGLTFSLSTGWQLPHVAKELAARESRSSSLNRPLPFGVDIHQKTPSYEGQAPQKNCNVTDGDCYCDGSGLLGEDFFQTLIAEGEEALWKRMEQQYKDWSKGE